MNETSTDPWTTINIEALAPDGKSLTAARELLRVDVFPKVEPTADGCGWWAICRGMTDVYRVVARPKSDGFQCECTCPSQKYPCKHALALLIHLSTHPAVRATARHATLGSLDFEGLLRAVFANPEDDTPRLVFADYLEENDQPHRAALIRTQCELSRLSADDPRRNELVVTERELRTQLQNEISALPEEFTLEFLRGFIQLVVRPGGFRNIGSLPASVINLFLNGWVEAVQLRDSFQAIGPVAHTLLHRAGELDFRLVPQGDIDLVRLASDLPPGVEGSRLARIRVHTQDAELFQALAQEIPATLPNQLPSHSIATSRHELYLTPDHLHRLIRAGRLDGVQDLHLSGETLGDAGAEVLGQSDKLTLTSLSLHQAGIGPEGVPAIAAATWFWRLIELRVTNSPFVNAGMGALGQTSRRTLLRLLHLRSIGVGDPGIIAFANSNRFPLLETLELPGNEIGDAGATALLASEYFPTLQTVDLSFNPVPVEKRAELVLMARAQPHLEVVFGETRIVRMIERNELSETIRLKIANGDKGLLEGLAATRGMERVTSLVLRGTFISAEVAGRITTRLSTEQWQELDLSGCSLGENVAAVVAQFCSRKCPPRITLAEMGMRYQTVAKLAFVAALASVKILDLSNNPMGASGLDALLGSPYLRGVERFIFRGLNLSQREREHFQKLFGKRAKFD